MPEDSANWINPGIRGMAPVGRRRVDPELHRLQWNENATGFPAELKEEVLQRLSALDWARYPHGLRPWVLIERLAAYCGVQPEQVVVSDGSSDLIKMVMAAILPPGATVVMPNPTFLLYGLNAQMQQARVVDIPLRPEDDFALPAQQIIEASHAHKAQLVVICAPNNPTGTFYPTDVLADVVKHCHGLVLIDEAYAEFCDQDLTHLLANGRVVLLRTLSKVFAMAGVRRTSYWCGSCRRSERCWTTCTSSMRCSSPTWKTTPAWTTTFAFLSARPPRTIS
ncbi:MAG: aminotransferase class I/II-fold pyridoxal phosphate-dependent enzyme [Anaerolineales bacterium]|nr:aminotransferase class I/II-fold pyridoxal phosphate-dependent enzyme [Anaerolineales bacterium]